MYQAVVPTATAALPATAVLEAQKGRAVCCEKVELKRACVWC
jgi:hypothetical protein